jgi:hypothetical protein
VIPKSKKFVKAFEAQVWVSPVPRERAIESVLEYRRGWNAEERAHFDSEVERGRHPVLVVESIELLSGQLASRATERTQPRVAT